MGAGGSADNTIRVCEVESGRKGTKLEGHTDPAFSGAMSADGCRDPSVGGGDGT